VPSAQQARPQTVEDHRDVEQLDRQAAFSAVKILPTVTLSIEGQEPSDAVRVRRRIARIGRNTLVRPFR
jgi:hypothetical protein